MRKMRKRNAMVITAAVMGLLVVAGSGARSFDAVAQTTSKVYEVGKEEAGSILLSMEPQIRVSYDSKGKVLGIKGVNEAGRKVVRNYSGFKGRSCEAVVNELVQEIYDAGYFDTAVEGKTRNIVVKLEKGSVYPDKDFLDDVAREVRNVVRDNRIDSSVVVLDQSDYLDNGYIGLEKAKEIVLAQLHISEAKFTDHEYDLEDGIYELEFTVGGIEYEYEVDAVTGKVMKADYERNDDWYGYDRDDRYDDDRYDDDRYDDDRYDDDHYDDDRYDDDRYDDDRYDDDRYDDDRYDDDRYDDDRYDDNHDDGRYDHDDDDDDRYDD